MKLLSKIRTGYILHPILFDILTSLALVLIQYKILRSFFVSPYQKLDTVIFSALSDLMNTSIVLVGFLLTALTIIVTFHDNLVSRNISVKNSAIKAILTVGDHYKNIIKVFSKSILVFFIIFFLTAIHKYFSISINTVFLVQFGLFLLVVSFQTIMRCLIVLYSLILVSQASNQNPTKE